MFDIIESIVVDTCIIQGFKACICSLLKKIKLQFEICCEWKDDWLLLTILHN